MKLVIAAFALGLPLVLFGNLLSDTLCETVGGALLLVASYGLIVRGRA